MWKKASRLFVYSIIISIAYLLFIYSPYLEENVAKAWREARQCDDAAILYLADYYAKRSELENYNKLVLVGAKCKKQWAIDLLNYITISEQAERKKPANTTPFSH